MPRGRHMGYINRKPGIFEQKAEKVYVPKLDKEGNPILDDKGNIVEVIDRNRVKIVINFNDKNGNRFSRVFEAKVNKEGNGVYIPTTSETELVSEYKEPPVIEHAPTPLALWNEAQKEAIREIRKEMGLGNKGRIPQDRKADYDRAIDLWHNENPQPAKQ